MLSIEAMRQLRDAYNPHMNVSEQAVLQKIGNPSADEIIETALAGMQSPDRNVRVLMLRVLNKQSGAKAMQGILTGLHDGKRRVRAVAIKCSRNYHHFPEIVNRLKAIALDEQEKNKIREAALSTLAGSEGHLVAELTDTAAEALESLAQMPKHRFQILLQLIRLDMNDNVKALLQAFVEHGNKQEAVMATRALYGYRVVHITMFQNDKAAEQYIRQTCEIAHERMLYWIPRDEYDRLTGHTVSA